MSKKVHASKTIKRTRPNQIFLTLSPNPLPHIAENLMCEECKSSSTESCP
jgi:hypothetical protein